MSPAITPAEKRILEQLAEFSHSMPELAKALGMDRSHVRKLVGARLRPLGLVADLEPTACKGWVVCLTAAGRRAIREAAILRPPGRPKVKPSVQDVRDFLAENGPSRIDFVADRMRAPITTVRRRLHKGREQGVIDFDINRRNRARLWKEA